MKVTTFKKNKTKNQTTQPSTTEEKKEIATANFIRLLMRKERVFILQSHVSTSTVSIMQGISFHSV